MIDNNQCVPNRAHFWIDVRLKINYDGDSGQSASPFFDVCFDELNCLHTEANLGNLHYRCPYLATDLPYSAAHQLGLHS